MAGLKSKLRVALVVVLCIWIGLAALYGLLKPVPNGCNMTYMYPTYIPISTPPNVSSEKYGLFLYHEGWKKINFSEHLTKLSGVPVLFIPGNGGSYKQVRSLAAESDRAYQGGPLEPTFYQDAAFTPEEGGNDISSRDLENFIPPNQYPCMLDWFAVDLEGEHSAMDGRILEEHTEYVVYAVHRILDQYQESRDARSKEGADNFGSLPRSVILVGHSMGGFVARAVIVHPHLRKSAVETIVTLSSPHQSPPVALQPSLGHFFSRVNHAWRKGYEIQTSRSGRWLSDPLLSNVIVVSITGGIRDYQVRSKLASLDGIIPPSHGFMIGTPGMKNVWLSMEHQSILWCNQLVIQVSHTLLSLVDAESGQPFPTTRKRLDVFMKMLRSGIPQSFNWMKCAQRSYDSKHLSVENEENIAGSRAIMSNSPCPSSVHWTDDSLERDLYISIPTVTVLAMDGRRRWMDIMKLGSNGKDHFVFVTNLAPCSGVRLHLWPERRKSQTEDEVPASTRVVEVTSKMLNIPAGPAPRQIEPGSQTEQAPPSAVLQLGPEELHGFRYLTISVAPRPTVSGRPPPAASMAVGQFFNPKEGEKKFSPQSLLLSSYMQEEIVLKEDHPLVLNFSFAISLGLLPVTLSLSTIGCGIKNSGLPVEQAGDVEHSSLCKLRCFPPVALVWDSTSGLHVIPNLYSETIAVDSSPAFWGSAALRSQTTTAFLMVDPHCSYRVRIAVSLTAAASRFLLLHGTQTVGLCIAVLFFALARQARAWELDLPMPSILMAVESNLWMLLPFLVMALGPMVVFVVFSLFTSQPSRLFSIFIIVTMLCYAFANGAMIILIFCSQMVFHVAATVQVFMKQRWHAWEESFPMIFRSQCFTFLSSFKVVRVLKGNPTLIVALIAISLVCFVHPALGLIVLLLSHASNCHTALCSFLAASFRSHTQRKENLQNTWSHGDVSSRSRSNNVTHDPLLPLDEHSSGSPNSAKSFGDTQLEAFQYRLGLLLLHLTATLMLVPSLIAWGQRIGMDQSIPWFADSLLSLGIILHGVSGVKPDCNALLFPSPMARGRQMGLSAVYFLSGYYCYLSGLASAPYRAFYAMAAVGIISMAFGVIVRRSRENRDGHFISRKHSHKH
ncbi:uncharacterized protein LOC18447579 isoform X1 [Amborella trichopoda]|uniref:uncharacterized protein LOC18447579 isoform X1 n=2 Tax=Amborella trichopoda TaxID=13333 RepID=UPI0009BE56F7|nr:uncharacterized protein LOC18447579 isoform X1 [Amborella trichopoda]|eukprot:XP_020531199.1 uncharacterized protein LOC18447579 isoform X1 [Amborella trichopoda]